MRSKPRALANATGAGALLASVLASACCIGPLALAAIGLGGAASFAGWEPYRPYLVTVTVILLGSSVLLGVRRRQLPSCPCPPAAWRSPLWLLAIGGTVLLLAASIVTVGGSALAIEAGTDSSAPGARAATFRVEGITCDSCAVGIRARLRKEPGVQEVRIQHATAHVQFDQSTVSAASIAEAIRSLGYGVMEIREPSADP